jgi:hypothetical protein
MANQTNDQKRREAVAELVGLLRQMREAVTVRDHEQYATGRARLLAIADTAPRKANVFPKDIRPAIRLRIAEMDAMMERQSEEAG